MEPHYSKSELERLSRELVGIGEDRAELQFWNQIFDDLSEEERRQLIDNLRTELAELQRIDKSGAAAE